jgi:hypothetical protein
MKNFLTSFIFSFSCLLVSAQQDRFIYLQTENQQPFFVKFNSKVINSSLSGYLIIPKLDDGLYSLVIGFPENDDQQEFNCSIRNKDIGFIIKNVGERQWHLLNVQTQTVIVPGDVITKPVIVYEKETDPFSIMLANAVHDSTILRKDIAREKPAELITKDTTQIIVSNTDAAKTNNQDSTSKVVVVETLPEKKTEVDPKILSDTLTTAVSTINNAKSDSTNKELAKEIVPEKPAELKQKDTAVTIIPNDIVSNPETVLKTDSTTIQNETVKVTPAEVNENKDSVQQKTVNNEVTLLRSSIKRKLKKTNKDGTEMMFIDSYGDIKDTIRILIPSEKKTKKDLEINTEPVVITPTQPDNKSTGIPDKKPDSRLSEEEKKVIQEANKEPAIKSNMINSDCKNFATEDDFLKARKKMVAENNDEDMVRAAKKIFKTKCFTTEQIKNLSVLFLKDEGKYIFFDAAYPFVSDSDVYLALENQLTDNYYITRFRAMIHK